ncbi:MAG: enoyl-CoA hydratase/isomerase family protein [Solirubrobacterales bacterium]|nr:enoyl-CoA hydratase/isomerase family protein [Solirubrobacterales bacterium]
MSDVILTEVNAATHVATLTLNKPEKFNAFDAELVDEWADALDRVAADKSVHAIVITGAGKAFCAGGELATLAAESGPLAKKEFLRDHVHRVQRSLQRVPQPVIAMINGAAMGAGLDMALLCDLRIAANEARIGEAYVNLGLVPGDGGAWLLTHLVGPARALELLLTGKVINGEQAAEWGLVNQSVPREKLSEVTYALAEKLAAGPQLAQRLIKRAVYTAESMPRDTHYDMVSSYMALAQSHDDFKGAIEAAQAGEKPVFESGDPRP